MVKKCKCSVCGREEVVESEKQAWMEGWSFIGKKEVCPQCDLVVSDEN